MFANKGLLYKKSKLTYVKKEYLIFNFCEYLS